MTDAPTSPGRRSTRLRWAVAAVVVLVLVVLIGPGRQDGPPLDLRSTGPLGLRGLAELLERLGTPVSSGDIPDGPGTALVVTDTLTDAQADELLDWVADGGRLVLADAHGELSATVPPDVVGLTAVSFTEPSIEPACDSPLVAGVARVAVSGAAVVDAPAGATACFPRNGGHWLVRQAVGQGEAITIGGPLTLTNELLGRDDTAVLLANLLVDPDGVRVVQGRDEATGEPLVDLLPDQVALALWQVPLAFLALVWWRGRRHGRPVEEPAPVRIDAAETTVAVGNLLGRAGRARDAAAIIRADSHRRITRRLGIAGLPADDPDAFVEVAAARSDVRPDTLRRVLVDPLPTDDDGLVAFAATAAHATAGLRQRRSADPVGGSTAGTPPPSSDPPTDRSTE